MFMGLKSYFRQQQIDDSTYTYQNMIKKVNEVNEKTQKVFYLMFIAQQNSNFNLSGNQSRC